MTKRTRGAITLAAMLAATALVSVPMMKTVWGAPGKGVHDPATPEETVDSFVVAPGLKATVWAHEPELYKPTNIDIDSKGRIWVTEAANYRSSNVRDEGDRVVILEDTKHTGVCDSSKVFVQDKAIKAPLGIVVLGNKVYVSQSPHMLVYTIDESGDKPAGPPQEVFTGFSGIDHDHGLHAAVFGPDGRFYFNCGNAGEEGAYAKFGPALSQNDGKPVTDITGTEIGGKSKMVHGHERKGNEGYREGLAMSMNLDGSDFEVLGYNFRNNYELTVDSYGGVWQSDNDDDGNQGTAINYVMQGGNFGYTGPTGSSWGRDEGQFKKTFPGQTHQEAQWHQEWPGVVPNLLNTGQGSPTGICVYEGDLLPAVYQGALLHCDAGPNVVRAYITRPGETRPKTIMKPVSVEEAEKFKKESSPTAGAGYEAVGVELIKGGDHWFRPSDVCVGPDGAVYVADWYDPGVGGHATGDTGTARNGHDWTKLHGRIYRLAPENFTPSAPKLDLATVPGQIAALDSPNFATRYLGYTKLAGSLDNAAVVDALKEQFHSAKHPWLRARALWLLARTKGGEAIVKEGLGDKDVDIRVASFRAARRIKLDVTQFASEVLADPAPAMWRELCVALQYDRSEKVLPLLVKLADKYNGVDRWYLEAFGIACNGRDKAVLDAWEKDHQNKDKSNNEGIVWRLKMETVQLPNDTPKPDGGHASAQGGAVPFK